MTTSEALMDALHDIKDPEIGINIVDLGLVYEAQADGDIAHVTYTLTTPGCPLGGMIAQSMEERLTKLPGIEHVDAKLVFSPPWGPELITENGREELKRLHLGH